MAETKDRDQKPGAQDGPAGQAEEAGDRLAVFKAEIINDFAEKHNVPSAVELGCGTGDLAARLNFNPYFGFDVVPANLEACRKRFEGQPGKQFLPYAPAGWKQDIPPLAHAALSVGVVGHLAGDAVFNTYMDHLFKLAVRYVVVYASNSDLPLGADKKAPAHKFTNWADKYRPDWSLAGFVHNKYPLDETAGHEAAASHFYFYSRGEPLHPRFSVYRPVPLSEAERSVRVDLRAMLKDSRTAYGRGDLEEAQKCLHKVLSRDPYNRTALTNLGFILDKLGETDKAESVFKRLLAYDPASGEAKGNLSRLYMQAQRWEDAKGL
ncbi:MAG: tetratricopeptide repeat protein [Deltaproteobacteria bacterium]|jgi:tetratricopeptide (TPR) repeat protein|nr:tetratricopeptide repeat protein [Deltaproteobacteria bacterium]